MEDWESDTIVERWIQDNDDTSMPLPAIESNPHLLISKVRKHYMEYLIQMLSVNYEKHQKLFNKNVYLPSAIWRCAKMIETSAAQASMVVHLYRKNITSVVKELKTNTKKGLLYQMLYQCLHSPPENDKKTQATFTRSGDCNCKCSCARGKKIKRNVLSKTENNLKNNIIQETSITTLQPQTEIQPEVLILNKCDKSVDQLNDDITMQTQNSDDLMQQLERLFQDDPNDDDLFDGALCELGNLKVVENNKAIFTVEKQPVHKTNIIESEESQKKCLDDRLVLLDQAIKEVEPKDSIRNQGKKHRISKWLCEEYFQKVKFFEVLDQISLSDGNRLARIKVLLVELFGPNNDEESVVSPLDDDTDFVVSCKERIAPWVVQMLTPYYVKGRIRGKTLFKSLAKHLIRLIYQCSKYPYEYEVQSFISDFLNTHKMIRCEADYKEFRIQNF